MEKLYREIKTTTINSEIVSYRTISFMDIFEYMNIIEDVFYSKDELNNVKSLNTQERINSFVNVLEKYNKDNPREPDLKLLINKESRHRLLKLLSNIYIDIDFQKISGKTYFLLYEFFNKEILQVNENILLQ